MDGVDGVGMAVVVVGVVFEVVEVVEVGAGIVLDAAAEMTVAVSVEAVAAAADSACTAVVVAASALDLVVVGRGSQPSEPPQLTPGRWGIPEAEYQDWPYSGGVGLQIDG